MTKVARWISFFGSDGRASTSSSAFLFPLLLLPPSVAFLSTTGFGGFCLGSLAARRGGALVDISEDAAASDWSGDWMEELGDAFASRLEGEAFVRGGGVFSWGALPSLRCFVLSTGFGRVSSS